MNLVISIILAALGAALGSFINVIIHRLPRKESIVFPASHCGDCGKAIPFYLNVPILSYIVLSGKCKYCGARIHWHHLLVEIITPVILIVLFLQYGLWNFLFYKYAILCLMLIPIFFIDAFHQIIPHKLSIPIIGIGVLSALHPQNDITLLNSVITAGVILAFLLALAYMYRWARKVDGLGGGDIWLLTGIAACVGFTSIPFVVIFSCLLGILYFMIFIRNKSTEFAFGTFIALATVIWILLGGDSILAFLKI